MVKRRLLGKWVCAVALAVSAVSSVAGADWRWVSSTDSTRWKEQPRVQTRDGDLPANPRLNPVPTTEPYPAEELKPADPIDLVVDPTKTDQTIEGFGGCFNEIGWRAMLRVDEVERTKILKALFDPVDGLDFNICRTPIGSSDFGLSYYSLDDTPGDYELKDFSIQRDKFMLIPYIKAALKVRPDLKVWASPWTPPAWMKTNGVYHGGRLKQDEKTLSSYATYLARYVEDYRAEGINISSVHVQNEPHVNNKYPTCLWPDPIELRDFTAKYVIPTFKKRDVKADVWFGTITFANFDYFTAALDDKEFRSSIGGVGLQYESRKVINQIHEKYPDLKLWQTETRCYNGQNDWPEAEDTFFWMQQFFRGGVSAYMYWNMILDQTHNSSWGWPQDSTIIIDQFNGNVIYTPQYYLMKHLSGFVKPGAKFIKSKNEGDPVMAFKTPAGGIVAVVTNTSRFDRKATLHLGKETADVTLPAHSFNTFVSDAK